MDSRILLIYDTNAILMKSLFQIFLLNWYSSVLLQKKKKGEKEKEGEMETFKAKG